MVFITISVGVKKVLYQKLKNFVRSHTTQLTVSIEHCSKMYNEVHAFKLSKAQTIFKKVNQNKIIHLQLDFKSHL